MRFSAVVPVYNEGANIAAFCARFVDELPDDGELLIVYDFDDDDTLAALAAVPENRKPRNIVTLKNTLGPGVRNAIVCGMRAARGPVVLVMMADLSDDFARAREMIERAEEGASVVCASRYMRGGRQLGGPWLKTLLSRAAGVSLHAVGALPVHDPTNSFKAYRRTFLEATPIESQKGFALAMELTVKAHRSGRRVEEVPATWRDRSAGESRFRLREWLGEYLRWYVRALAQWNVVSTLALPLAIVFGIGAIVPIRMDTHIVTEYWMQVVLHEAFLHAERFGRDLVFTFGPYGFLLGGFDVRTADLMFALHAVIAVVGLLALWSIVRARGPGLALVVAAAIVVHLCWTDTFYHFLPLLILIAGFERPRGALYWPLIAAGALLGLAKFSIMVMVTAAVLAVSVDELRRRALPKSALVHAASVLLLWLAARQRFSDLVPFVRNSLELAGGYVEAMLHDDAMYAPGSFVPFFASAIAFTLVAALVERRRGALRALFFLGGWSALLLLLFKAAFVRADHFHIAPAAGAILLFQLAYAATRVRRGRAGVALLLLLPIAFSVHLVLKFGEGSIVRDVIAAFRDSARSAARLARWPSYRAGMAAIQQQAVEASAAPREPMRGDIYPSPFGIIARSGFTYEHRPVYVSYAAYTPRLARMNAEWLARTQPENVLFDIDPIDHQFPTMQDGASWPLLFARYAPDGRAGRHVVLARWSGAMPRLARIASADARLGERVVLPASPRLFARVFIDHTTRGKLASLLYKPPPLTIRVGLEGGTEKTFRFVRRMAQSEFLLSPLVEDAGAFEALFTRAPGRAVRWIVIDTRDRRAYERAYRIEFLETR